MIDIKSNESKYVTFRQPTTKKLQPIHMYKYLHCPNRGDVPIRHTRCTRCTVCIGVDDRLGTCRIYYTIGMGSGRVRLAYNSKLEARRFLVAAGVPPCVKILLCQRGLRHLTPIYYRQPLCAGRCILLAYIPILMTGISLGWPMWPGQTCI